MIIGTAGHIDHGKSTLVQALTGVATDRLKEEQARGMSIELGYAYLPIGGAVADPGAILGFVDVPGHERFLHHMLAGVGGIDFVLLLVALDDGVMPQTREHLQILQLLGLQAGAVILTKRDRVDAAREAAVRAEVDALVRGTFLQDCPRFALSCRNGEGVEELRAFLLATASATPAKVARGGFRLAIDRCFTLQGVGTVVTGTAHAGQVRTGDRLVLCPGGTPVRVRSLHVHNVPAAVGAAGQRCAINIAGAHLDRQQVQRGQWLVAEELAVPTADFDFALSLLTGEEVRLRDGLPVHVHLGAENVLGRLHVLEGPTGTEPRLARLTLDRPIGALHGDRLVVRDGAGARTVGGGRVLDAEPPRRGRRTPERLAWLRACAQGGSTAALAQLATAFPDGLPLAQWQRMANLWGDTAVQQLAALPVVQAPGPLLFCATAWRATGDEVLGRLAAHHAAHPGEAGLPATELRSALRRRWSAAVFDALLQQLRSAGQLARTGAAWHLPEHRVRLSQAEQRLWARIEPLLAAGRLAPPRVDQLARQLATDEAAVRAVLDRACQTGSAWRVSDERYYLPAAITELAHTLRRLGRGGEAAQLQPLTAAAVRDEIGIGRNLVVALLEFFDRCGATRRVGDAHWLCNDPVAILEDA